MCHQGIIMCSLDEESNEINAAIFVFVPAIKCRITIYFYLLAAELLINKVRSSKAFIHQSEIKCIFFYKMIIVYIGADHAILRAGCFIFRIKDPTSVIADIRLMRHINREASIRRRIFFPVGDRGFACSIFFQLNAIEEPLRFLSQSHIFAGAAHFENDHFKWRGKNIIPLNIAAACLIYQVNSMISISDDRGFADDLTWYVFIQQTINDLSYPVR